MTTRHASFASMLHEHWLRRFEDFPDTGRTHIPRPVSRGVAAAGLDSHAHQLVERMASAFAPPAIGSSRPAGPGLDAIAPLLGVAPL